MKKLTCLVIIAMFGITIFSDAVLAQSRNDREKRKQELREKRAGKSQAAKTATACKYDLSNEWCLYNCDMLNSIVNVVYKDKRDLGIPEFFEATVHNSLKKRRETRDIYEYMKGNCFYNQKRRI